MGYPSGPSYAASGVAGGTVTASGATATFKPTRCGVASFVLKVTDSAGSTMSKSVGVFVDGGTGVCP